VMPGKRMAGHLGDVQRTTQNLVIARIDKARQCCWCECGARRSGWPGDRSSGSEGLGGARWSCKS